MKQIVSQQGYLPPFLLFILMALSIWSGINPYSSQVWLTEFISALLVIVPICCLYPSFKFSNTGYMIAFLWCVLQIIGAHYSFERVPFQWISDLFGFGRNHYDRVAHFTIGLSAFLIAEFVWRKKYVSSVRVACVFGIIGMMAVANFWELVEWIYAEADGGDAGAAFLGSQGDIWDAQKDMLMDTLGGIVGSLLFYYQNKRK